MHHLSDKRVPRILILVAALLVGPAARADAQRLPVGDPQEAYLRILQLAGAPVRGSFTVRPLRSSLAQGEVMIDPWNAIATIQRRDTLAGGLWAEGVHASAHAYANSAFPWVANDGAVWQGKGLTASVEGGATFGLGPVTLTIDPLVTYAQNGDFDLAHSDLSGPDDYWYAWHSGIDWPQRFGPDALSSLDPGQSSVRVDLGGATVGFGWENLWWGPGQFNALVMTNNAAGFPHADLSTDGPVNVGIGTIEAQWIWGRLYHSDWWSAVATTRDRFITGAVLAFSPRGVDGLTLGLTRVFQQVLPEGRLAAGEYFLVFQSARKQSFVTDDNYQGNDARDQIASAFARWLFPESGFEIYGEYGRNDHAWDLKDYFLEPEHSRAFLWGLRKVGHRAGNRLVSVTLEVTQLERSQTLRVRASPTWYEHHRVSQGYTHRGQILGAGLGPGGNAQYLGADFIRPDGRLTFFLNRRVHDNDAFYDMSAPGDADRHHVSLDLGGDALFLTGEMEVGVGVTLTKDFNRYFIVGNDVWNGHVEVSARWRR